MNELVKEMDAEVFVEPPPKPKLFAWINSLRNGVAHVIVIAEDGTRIASYDAMPQYAQTAAGVASEKKQERYMAHYPNGYELVWIDDPKPGKDLAFDNACALAQTIIEAKEESEGR